MVLPIETCPSPATATCPRWRTAITVVARMRSREVMGRALSEIARKTRGAPAHVRPPRSFRAGAWMGGVVDAHELIRAYVRVALGRRQAAVAQELLDHPKVGAGVEQMGREGMAQGVRAHAPGDPG